VASSDYLLSLVRQALDEFDTRSLEVTVRRAVRIASLAGDSRTAVRLGYELRPSGGGDRKANAADVKRLMTDPSTWGTGQGPSEEALQEYFADRARSDDAADDTVLVHSVAELEFWVSGDHAEFGQLDQQNVLASMRMRQILELTRHRTFTALIAWERQFTYSSINESIFSAYQMQVDQLLSAGTPDLVEKFTAVYQRLREAAAHHPELEAPEELSQAIMTCRRILKAVVNHVFPPSAGASSGGHSLDDAHHRNRLYEFIARCGSGSHRALVKVMASGLYDRFEAVDTLTNKAVHAEMALEIANLCALNTYIVCGEVLRVHLLGAGPEPATPA
jgi:hypothetical protein